MSDPAADVRCPSCARLLARRTAGRDGLLVEWGDRLTMRVLDGSVSCGRCGSVVVVEAGEVAVIRLGCVARIAPLAGGLPES